MNGPVQEKNERGREVQFPDAMSVTHSRQIRFIAKVNKEIRCAEFFHVVVTVRHGREKKIQKFPFGC